MIPALSTVVDMLDRLIHRCAGVLSTVPITRDDREPPVRRDDDLEWLLCQAPALLGLRSTHGGIVAALEGGGSGAFDSSAAESLCERALPHVARARRLGVVWAALDAPTRRVLVTHYTPRASWPPGVTAMLGVYAAVTMSMTTDRARLELACCHGALATNQAVIRRERGRAERAVARAHRAWREAKTASMIAWVRTG